MKHGRVHMLFWVAFILSAAAFKYIIIAYQTTIFVHKSVAAADKKTVNETQILTINLIGERHCGTKWITKHLEDCFGSHITVLNRYTRYKHWFQYEEDTSDPRHYYPPNSAIVVAMFRDPYQWVNAMQKKPYHALDHHNLSWERFVTTPWGIGRGEKDRELIEYGETTNATCVHRFDFKEVVPCTIEDRNDWRNGTHSYTNRGLMYELDHDGSGNRYGSIVNLRRDKIENFLSVRNYPAVAALYPVQYEYLVSRGTADLIYAIENVTGVHPQCKPSTPREFVPKQLDAQFIKWMNDNVDWEVENMIGYYKTDSNFSRIVAKKNLL
ncbi:hypothetical protein ACHAWT_011139 [Skeletonema menzelii]